MSETPTQSSTLASLPTLDCKVDVEHRARDVLSLFEADPALHAVLLMRGTELAGVVSRRQFQRVLTRAFGREVFLKRPMSAMAAVMDTTALVLPVHTPIHEAAKLALARDKSKTYEPIVVVGEAAAPAKWCLLDMVVLLQAQSELLSRHIAALQTAEQARERLQNELLRVSRHAGMAEVATGVLHNVGNVLNSVMVSTSRISSVLQQSRVGNVRLTADLIRENEGALAEFFTQDQRGKALPGYLTKLADLFGAETGAITAEVGDLVRNVEHIRQIVAAQQSFATIKAVREVVKPQELLEDAVRINALSLERHKVEVIRDYEDTGALVTDKHHVLQILVNLISNAKKAVRDGQRPCKQVTLRIRRSLLEGVPAVVFEVADNGIGIAPERLTKIFSHGFTTREDGHGFGLHTSANAARQLGGVLRAASDGPHQGAAFTLILPQRPDEAAHEPAGLRRVEQVV